MNRERTTFSRKSALEIVACLAALGSVVGVSPKLAGAAETIVGAWSLISFDVDEGKGVSTPRFGPNPVGYLIYSADARMGAVLAGTHRPALEAPAGTSASEEKRTEALRNFLAYAGRYEVRGDRVFHHVEVSVFTNLVGVTLERQFKIEGEKLTIRTLPPEIWGSANVLVWQRAGG